MLLDLLGINKVIKQIKCRLQKLENNSNSNEGDFIPLSGTTEGNPVTGSINFEQYSGSKLISSSEDGTNEIDLTENDEGVYITHKDFSGNISGQLIVNGNGIGVNSGALGYYSNTDYSEIDPTNKLIYAQRSYVDTKVPKVSTSGVERVYTINPDGSQATKPTSDFGTIKGTGTINRISKFTASGTIGDSQIFDNGTNVGIGTTTPQARLDVKAQGVLATDIAFRVRNSTDTKNFLVVNGAGDVYNNGAGGINTNTFFGGNVGRSTTGIDNTALGFSALQNNTTGNSNTAIGTSALQSNTTGVLNIAIGASALFANTTGVFNTALGFSALFANTTGAYNTAIGTSALQSNTTGAHNTALGFSALQNNTTGAYNTALGRSTLLNITSGSLNIAIGLDAGRLISNGSNQTISNNSVFIGYDTRALADNQINQIVIGHQAIGLGSNSVVLGNTSITRTQLRGQVIMGAFASAPTGIEGAIYYDSTTKKHYGFDGTTWNALY